MTFNRTVAAAIGATLLISLAALGRLAARPEVIDADTASRLMQIATGLTLVAFANGAPKQIGRPRVSLEAEGRAQAARRIAGWSLTLAGLIYAGTWIFAPVALAAPASIAVVAIGLTVAVLCARSACRSRRAFRAG